MTPIAEAIVTLALDPFASANGDRAVRVDGGALALSEIRTALQTGPEGDQSDWSRCDTCSDPGFDKHNPWPPR